MGKRKVEIMKIAILGYGKMGKAIEKQAVALGHEIVLRIGSTNADELTFAALKKADVAIEFSLPELAEKHILSCAKAGIPVVVGTTGWYDRYTFCADQVRQGKGALLAATNFSIGVQLFFKLNAWFATIMNRHEAYRISISETHHLHKKDAPSGTAITLAERILSTYTRKKGWSLNPDTNEIPIEAIRKDEVPGTHDVRYTSNIDEIQLTHTAFNRDGFALGAVMAAEWLNGKKGVFTMDDFMEMQ